MPFKIAACVILYHPDKSVEQNIQSYSGITVKTYIIENSEERTFNFNPDFKSLSQAVYLHDGNNAGIAKRLNQACELAWEDGFEYLLTMDQDSYFDESVLKSYFNCIDAYSGKEKVAMFGINYESPLSSTECSFEKVNFLITSGSVINLSVYKQTGGFDENLFIDFVDTEYCLRSIITGFDTIRFPHIFMHHNLGETIEKRSLKSLQKTKRSFHSPLRLYYMTRNYLYISSKYNDVFKAELSILKKDLLNRIKNRLLYKSGRIKTIQYLLKAVSDYRNNKLGKRV